MLAVPWIAEAHVRRLKGNAVVEFLPNIACHKGDATRWIARDVEARLARPAWVVFVGDDVTDEDAFRAIDRGHRRARRAARTAATHQLDSIAEVDRFLRWLAGRG